MQHNGFFFCLVLQILEYPINVFCLLNGFVKNVILHPGAAIRYFELSNICHWLTRVMHYLLLTLSRL